MSDQSHIHVYFVPGLAASSTIFERIKLPENYSIHLIEWILPEINEPISNYVDRLLENVKEENPVLIGVSFGGIIVQEMSKKISTKKTIIISSIKCQDEMPKRLRITKGFRLNKILPTGIFKDLEKLKKIAFFKTLKDKIKLYEKYMKVNDKNYLDWAIDNVLNWQRINADPNIIHIHGTNDTVFPIKYIKNFISVKGASHVLVMSHAKWLNNFLPKIIENDIKNINFEQNK